MSDQPPVPSPAADPAAPRPGERIVEVEWSPTSGSLFLVQIQVEALDRNRLLADITRVLSDNHLNILAATVSTGGDRMAISKFTFEMGDPAHLDHVMNAVRKVEGVVDAYRITGGSHKRS